MRKILITLLLFSQLAIATAPAEDCYPGLDCEALAVRTSCSAVDGAPISGLAFTHDFILDSGAKLLWSRVLDAAGSTKERFASAEGGQESYAAVLERLSADVQTLPIGGQTGWRLANANEMDRLLKLMSPPTLYHYFRSISIATGASNVIGAYAAETSPGLVNVVGVQHANVLSDVIAYTGLGGGALNEYGFWLVKAVDGGTLDELHKQAAPVRETFEPTEQVSLDPISMHQVRRHSTGVEFERVVRGEATVRVYGGMQTRFIAHYNLKPLPRGGLAGVEIELRGTSASGSPIPLMELRVLARDRDDLTAPDTLWTFNGGERVGVWQFPNTAKLRLPDHIARNAYHAEQDLYIWFSVDSNAVSFRAPKLTAYLVNKEHLLTERQRP